MNTRRSSRRKDLKNQKDNEQSPRMSVMKTGTTRTVYGFTFAIGTRSGSPSTVGPGSCEGKETLVSDTTSETVIVGRSPQVRR